MPAGSVSGSFFASATEPPNHRLSREPRATVAGGKGLHVVVPLAPRSGWDRLKDFSEAMARAMADDHPELYLAKASKAARSGRIFIDYLRNGRGSTAIAPFSSRARRGTPVAWPIAWDRLGRIENGHPASIATAAGMLKRRKRDPWRSYFDVDQDLPRI